jgi:hypothetical protein
MIYGSAEKDRCASPPGSGCRSVANKVREPYGPVRLKVRLIQETNINAVLTEQLFQFQLFAANTISVQPLPRFSCVAQPYSSMKRITVMRTARGRASPAGRDAAANRDGVSTQRRP